MTVYKAIKAEAEAAAELAVALATGEDPPAADDEIDNGTKQVPSILLTPVAVTKDNINDTIIKDEFWTAGPDLHRQVRRWLQGGWHPVGDVVENGRRRLAGRRRPSSWKESGIERQREHTRARPEGGEQELRPGPGAQRRGLRGSARRGRGARGRQRRRQVHAREDDRRNPSAGRGHDLLRGPGGHDHEPHRRGRRSESRPCTRTSRSATTSTSSRTSFSGARRPATGRPRSFASSTRSGWRSRPASCSRTSP